MFVHMEQTRTWSSSLIGLSAVQFVILEMITVSITVSLSAGTGSQRPIELTKKSGLHLSHFSDELH